MAKSLQDMISGEVRAEMARQGVTQIELAGRLGTDQPWISKRVTGKVPFDTRDLERIASALGVSVTQFLPADSTPADAA